MQTIQLFMIFTWNFKNGLIKTYQLFLFLFLEIEFLMFTLL